MSGIDRRQLLTAGGALLLATTVESADAADKPRIPRPPKTLPKRWIDAPSMPL